VKRMAYAALVMRALAELCRYEILDAAFGFKRVYRDVERQRVAPRRAEPDKETQICEAVTLATCLYWKRVFCLQRSAVAARLLKKSGIDARLVIGYRPSPFFSHAWVEVNGRVVNDSPAYKERMHVLCTF
jgi:Transglutaminase-like superfamily